MFDFQKVRWYAHRLVSMSPTEVGQRIQQRVTIARDRINGLPDAAIDAGFSVMWEQFQEGKSPPFFFRWEERPSRQEQYKGIFAQEYAALRDTAAALIEHRIDLFGQHIDLGDKIAWQTDPLTRKTWPEDFYANIDTRDGETFGGVKWVWELNRHYHFVTLGKAFFLSGEDVFAETLCDQWRQWIIANPPLRGVNWTSALEMAIRLINWTWALAFIRRSPALTEALFNQIAQSVFQQATFISRHLSAHSSANNHLIGEAAGLAVAGLCFPALPSAAKWRDNGLKILEIEFDRQISSAGVPAEQALSYLAFVLDFNLIVWQLAQLNGYELPTRWAEKLGAACDFIASIMDEKGHVPAIGDSDDAWVVRLDDRPRANNYRSILATAAVILGRPDLKACAGRWDEKSDWLLGKAGYECFEALPLPACELKSRLFADGGYAAMHAPGRVIVTDFGPLGYLSTAAHGHADALSLTISVDGNRFVVDPGTYAYQEGGKWRDYFRSTSAHNTITVGRQDQSEMRGDFLWGRKAQARLVAWQSGPDQDLLIAEHDGFSKFGVIHKRVVLFYKPDWLIVGDELLGTGRYPIEQFWHLHPAFKAEIVDDRVMITGFGQKRAIFIDGWPLNAVSIHQGEFEPILGWYSALYGQKEPAATIRVSAEVELPARFATIFALKDDLYSAAGPDTIQRLLRLINGVQEEEIH